VAQEYCVLWDVAVAVELGFSHLNSGSAMIVFDDLPAFHIFLDLDNLFPHNRLDYIFPSWSPTLRVWHQKIHLLFFTNTLNLGPPTETQTNFTIEPLNASLNKEFVENREITYRNFIGILPMAQVTPKLSFEIGLSNLRAQ